MKKDSKLGKAFHQKEAHAPIRPDIGHHPLGAMVNLGQHKAQVMGVNHREKTYSFKHPESKKQFSMSFKDVHAAHPPKLSAQAMHKHQLERKIEFMKKLLGKI